MSSFDDRSVIDEVITTNGSDGTTHIIEYQNQFDGRTAWKLCRGKRIYEIVGDRCVHRAKVNLDKREGDTMNEGEQKLHNALTRKKWKVLRNG